MFWSVFRTGESPGEQRGTGGVQVRGKAPVTRNHTPATFSTTANHAPLNMKKTAYTITPPRTSYNQTVTIAEVSYNQTVTFPRTSYNLTGSDAPWDKVHHPTTTYAHTELAPLHCCK